MSSKPRRKFDQDFKRMFVKAGKNLNPLRAMMDLVKPAPYRAAWPAPVRSRQAVRPWIPSPLARVRVSPQS